MAIRVCKLPDCDAVIIHGAGLGYCRPHYRAFKAHGDPYTRFAPKVCAECGEQFAPTHGSHKSCDACRAVRVQRLAKGRREANREANVEYNRKWREANPTYHAEYNKAWREANPEAYLEYAARYRAENHDLVRQRHADWESRNPNHTTEWTRRNRERARETVRRRRSRLRQVPTFEVSDRDIRRMLIRFGNSCAYCPASLADGYHIDHVVPVSLGGSNGIGNIVPACPACNTSKSNWLLAEWRYKDRLSGPLRRRYALTA